MLYLIFKYMYLNSFETRYALHFYLFFTIAPPIDFFDQNLDTSTLVLSSYFWFSDKNFLDVSLFATAQPGEGEEAPEGP